MDIHVKAMIETAKTAGLATLFGLSFYLFIEFFGLGAALITLMVGVLISLIYTSYRLHLHALKYEQEKKTDL